MWSTTRKLLAFVHSWLPFFWLPKPFTVSYTYLYEMWLVIRGFITQSHFQPKFFHFILYSNYSAIRGSPCCVSLVNLLYRWKIIYIKMKGCQQEHAYTERKSLFLIICNSSRSRQFEDKVLYSVHEPIQKQSCRDEVINDFLSVYICIFVFPFHGSCEIWLVPLPT